MKIIIPRKQGHVHQTYIFWGFLFHSKLTHFPEIWHHLFCFKNGSFETKYPLETSVCTTRGRTFPLSTPCNTAFLLRWLVMTLLVTSFELP